MKITDLKGTRVKKDLGAQRCAFRYHNKNKSGGNFGFIIRGLEGMPYDCEINGDYWTDGTIRKLGFGKVYWAIGCLPSETYRTYENLIEFIKSYIATAKVQNENTN